MESKKLRGAPGLTTGARTLLAAPGLTTSCILATSNMESTDLLAHWVLSLPGDRVIHRAELLGAISAWYGNVDRKEPEKRLQKTG